MPEDYMRATIDKMEKEEGKALKMSRENGVYSFNLWTPKPPARKLQNRFEVLQEDEEGCTEGFRRLGRLLE